MARQIRQSDANLFISWQLFGLLPALTIAFTFKTYCRANGNLINLPSFIQSPIHNGCISSVVQRSCSLMKQLTSKVEDESHLLVHSGRLDDVLAEPWSSVGCDREGRHLRELASGQLHVRQQRRQSVVVHSAAVVVRKERLAGVGAPSAPSGRFVKRRLVLPLVLVASVGEFDQKRLRRARQQFAVEDADDLLALFSRFHPVENQTFRSAH